MDFDKMTPDELLDVDSTELTSAQAIFYTRALEKAFPDEETKAPASTQASPIEDWTEGVTEDGRRYLQDPKYPKNIKWLTGKAPIFSSDKRNIYDEKAGRWVPVEGLPEEPGKETTLATNTTEKYIIRLLPNGDQRWIENPNYVPPKSLQERIAESSAIAAASRAPQKSAAQLADEEYQKEAAKARAEREFQPEVGALREAQAGNYQATTAATNLKLQQDQQGKAATALAQRAEFAQRVADLLADPKSGVDMAKASAYMDAFDRNLEAELRGTTVFQEQKQKQDTETERAKVGQSLLNQRLSSGASVANQLLSGFYSNLDTLGWGLKPGETVPFNPFAMADQFTTQMQGGPEVSDTAKGLLAGIAPQGAPSPSFPMAPAAATSPPQEAIGPIDLDAAYRMGRQADLAAAGTAVQ